MLLKEFILLNPKISKWSIYNNKQEQIAMTSRSVLLILCDTKREFKKTINTVDEISEISSFARLRLN